MVPLLYHSRFQAARSIKSCLDLGERECSQLLQAGARRVQQKTLGELENCHPLVVTMGFPGGSDGKASAYSAGDRVRYLGREDPLEKEMETHSSTLAWKILWIEVPSRLQSMGSQRVGHDWATSLSLGSHYGPHGLTVSSHHVSLPGSLFLFCTAFLYLLFLLYRYLTFLFSFVSSL